MNPKDTYAEWLRQSIWLRQSMSCASYGHPLACGIWRDAVCTCDPPRPAVSHSTYQGDPDDVTVHNDAPLPEERHDTEPAPDARCYTCGTTARAVVYRNAIPSCLQCAERAGSRRRSDR